MNFLLILLMVLWTTARHEAAHALAAVASGGTIQELRLLPGIHPEQGFYFGYVAHSGASGWIIDAAPFLLDFLLLALAAGWLARIGTHRRIAILFGVISPLIDLAYAYQGGLWRSGTDAHDLLAALPDPVVHGAFLTAILAAVLTLRYRERLTPDPAGGSSTSTAG